MVLLLLNCTWVSLPEAQQSQSTDTGLWWRKVQCLWHGSKEREWCSKSLPQWLSGKGFSRQREGASHRVRDQPVGSSLMGWWWVNRGMFQESLCSVFWSGVYILMASMQWGVQYLWDSLRKCLRILSITLEEEPKVLDFVFNGSTIIILSGLTIFLCFFIFSLLWLNLHFRTQGRPRRLDIFYQQEARGHRVWGGLSPWEGPAEFSLVSCHILLV